MLFYSLFNTFFTVQSLAGRPEIPGITLQPIANETNAAKFDLIFSFSEQDNQLYGGVEYKTDLFSEERIAQLCQHFETLLATVLQQPDTPLSHIDVRTEVEKSTQATARIMRPAQQTVTAQLADITTQFADKTAVSTATTSVSASLSPGGVDGTEQQDGGNRCESGPVPDAVPKCGWNFCLHFSSLV